MLAHRLVKKTGLKAYSQLSFISKYKIYLMEYFPLNNFLAVEVSDLQESDADLNKEGQVAQIPCRQNLRRRTDINNLLRGPPASDNIVKIRMF